jgi:arabinofuranan 3-O-arabinosyltransferase
VNNQIFLPRVFVNALAPELAPIPAYLWPALRPWLKILTWILALVILGQRAHHAYHEFDTITNEDPLKRKPENNNGHAQIDFGGQWVMGRMLVMGHGKRLYHRQMQWQVTRAGFAPEREAPLVALHRFPVHLRDSKYQSDVIWHESEWMMFWFMGADSPKWNDAGKSVTLSLMSDALFANPLATVALAHSSAEQFTPDLLEEISKPAIGGPLYPPVHAFVYAPLGLFEKPETAYRVFQFVCLLLAVVGGFAVSYMSNGRFWASIATFCLLMYPGYRSGLDLGQNPALSVAILLGGVALAVRGRPILGGIVWGMLAFKPVWAVTFLLIPLMLRQWKFLFAMMGTGAFWILVTLPFVGVQCWFDWLEVGKEASGHYNVNETWNTLSRDLHGLIRRLLLDFSKPDKDRNEPYITTLCWSLWGFVFVTTMLITLWKTDRKWISPVTGFAMLGMLLCSYRFMYYDIMLSSAGVLVCCCAALERMPGLIFVLRSQVNQVSLYLASLPMTFLVFLLMAENWFITLGAEITAKLNFMAYPTTNTSGVTGLFIPSFQAVANVYYPHDTLLVLLLWAILAVTLLIRRREAA